MVKAIYFLKPAWCGNHPAGLRPEEDLQSVIVATAFQAVVWRLAKPSYKFVTIDSSRECA